MYTASLSSPQFINCLSVIYSILFDQDILKDFLISRFQPIIIVYLFDMGDNKIKCAQQIFRISNANIRLIF